MPGAINDPKAQAAYTTLWQSGSFNNAGKTKKPLTTATPTKGLSGVTTSEITQNARNHSQPVARFQPVANSQSQSQGNSWYNPFGLGSAATSMIATPLQLATATANHTTSAAANMTGLKADSCTWGQHVQDPRRRQSPSNPCITDNTYFGNAMSDVASALQDNTLTPIVNTAAPTGRRGGKYKSNKKSKRKQSKKKKGGKRKSKKNRKSKKRI